MKVCLVASSGGHLKELDFVKKIDMDFQYFIIWENEKLPQLEKMAVHFDYLTEDCGVRISKNHFYQTVEDDDNVGVLFPVGMLKLIHSGTAVKTKKYQI